MTVSINADGQDLVNSFGFRTFDYKAPNITSITPSSGRTNGLFGIVVEGETSS